MEPTIYCECCGLTREWIESARAGESMGAHGAFDPGTDLVCCELDWLDRENAANAR